jgi:hypothetical protein
MAIRSPGRQMTEAPNHSAEPHNRRGEARIEDRHGCVYEICESGGRGVATIQQGQVFTLNRSAHGILLLMGDAPRVDQLIDIHNGQLGWRRSTMVYQVRWTRPLRVESQGDLFLVGCRQVTGSLR